MMTIIQIECAKTALEKMMRGGHLDITLIRQILEMTGGVPDGKDWQALQMLHCVDFRDFPPTLRIEFPNLLRRVLQSPSMEINITFKALETPPNLLPAIQI